MIKPLNVAHSACEAHIVFLPLKAAPLIKVRLYTDSLIDEVGYQKGMTIKPPSAYQQMV
jgi:hypothetical protein